MSKMVRSNYSSRTFDSDKFRLVKEWNNESASYVYGLYNRHETFIDGFARPHFSWNKVSEGDDDWAKITAEHYSIEIESKS